ncbi:hypothetical protein BLS_003326 [Venturia inaequalis]|uniref:HAUS augmin-like complex subunit 3 N-terminal domain-containing protein n=1 Tax=Venturia inaequalis TaxID=5025 RepID=A0A8H3VVE7_VENIN|nr:hypothetical protein BLS_003326 [Venturia inaequalis]KAE9994297.1 hypothetical protein EG327_011399 [Venturia inaequalis]RDI86744.1 hypothetical protein Vi05172_g3270 [Venturia inaequalis]
MTDVDARQQLLSALYKRGIDLGPDDVNWAFESQKTNAELTAWIREYLDSSTLLTRDELDLYEAVQGKRSLDSQPSDTVPLQEFDIKDAIDSLKASTAAIEKHSITLEAQRGALLAFKEEGSRRQEISFFQKYGQESGRLLFAVDDLLHQTKDQLSEAEKDSTRATAIMKAVVSERLAADDQVFEALEKLTPKVSEVKALPVESATIDKWTRALASLRVLEAKANLDANLKGFGDRGGQTSDEGTPALKTELEGLQSELQTLRDEIESVVQMVIGNEIRDPLLKNVQSLEGHSRQTRNGWSSYILTTLHHLVSQLESLNSEITSLQSYNKTLHSLTTLLQEAFSESPHNTQCKDDSTRAIGPNAAPSKLRPAAEISGPATYATQALRRFCASLTDSTNTNIIGRLDATTAEATSRLRGQHVAAVNATLESLSKSLGEKQREFMRVTDQLFINSRGSSVHLGESGLEERLGRLNRGVEEVAPLVARADVR